MMEQDKILALVREIMLDFARETGLAPATATPRRYLWTDAFAVCNFLELFRLTDDEQYRSLALQLVDQVHNVLGRHRRDDSRQGWISGLDEEMGRHHPTAGGLRIGKKLNERGLAEPYDDHLEWDRDGQYYHYLTKWMHALLCVSRVTGAPVHNSLARELAQKVHSRFVYRSLPGGPASIHWKMSIDLSRPLVPSMGQHDPLDGLITYLTLQNSGPVPTGPPDLSHEIQELASICRGKDWRTADPLSLGGLLCDAARVAGLISHGVTGLDELLKTIIANTLPGLAVYAERDDLLLPADYRLAFRELGLAIGLRAVPRLRSVVQQESLKFEESETLNGLLSHCSLHMPLADSIERFWLEASNQDTATWREHRDINMVMLATSLAPDTFLGD